MSPSSPQQRVPQFREPSASAASRLLLPPVASAPGRSEQRGRLSYLLQQPWSAHHPPARRQGRTQLLGVLPWSLVVPQSPPRVHSPHLILHFHLHSPGPRFDCFPLWLGGVRARALLARPPRAQAPQRVMVPSQEVLGARKVEHEVMGRSVRCVGTGACRQVQGHGNNGRRFGPKCAPLRSAQARGRGLGEGRGHSLCSKVLLKPSPRLGLRL